jgi:hypothetical protein
MDDGGTSYQERLRFPPPTLLSDATTPFFIFRSGSNENYGKASNLRGFPTEDVDVSDRHEGHAPGSCLGAWQTSGDLCAPIRV